jgi:hypothetical protein
VPPLAALLALAAMASTGATAQTATQTSDPVGCLESLRLARQSDDEEHAASPECIEKIETYYALKEPRNCDRIWMNPKAEKQGDSWVAKLPMRNVDDCVFAFANFHGRHPLESRPGRRHANSSANSYFAKELQLIGSPEWQTLEIPPEKLRFLGNRDLLSVNHEKTTDDDEEKV